MAARPATHRYRGGHADIGAGSWCSAAPPCHAVLAEPAASPLYLESAW